MAATIDLPVINISTASAEAGKEMLAAAVKYGFLYVDSTSTQFDKETVDKMFELSRRFFKETPFAEKEKYKIKGDNRGWSGMHSETLDPENQERGDFKEAMNFGEFRNGKPTQEMPESLVPQEAQIKEFHNLCRITCLRILEILALGLGIPLDWFASRHDASHGPTGSVLRTLYYPNVDDPSIAGYRQGIDIRAGAHSDYGSMTLLFQRDGQPGLQIRTPEETWASVPVRPSLEGAKGDSRLLDKDLTPPPILVNIADCLSYWTAGLLKSTIHRVIFPTEAVEGKDVDQQALQQQKDDRYSIAYFCHPINDTELVPVPSDLVEERKKSKDFEKVKEELLKSTGGFVPKNAKEHLAARLAFTYGGTVKEFL